MSYYNNAAAYPGYAEATPTNPYGLPPNAQTYGTIADGSSPVKQVSITSPRTAFACTGVILLGLLMLIPVWNASALLQDANYVFWAGNSLPQWIIAICLTVLFLYVMTILAFFGHARPQMQTEQTVMMIGNIFVTLLGLVLMLSSLPMLNQTTATYNNLMHHCDKSIETHRVYEYSQVLQNMRRQPDCAAKLSVEECAGYQESPPYTGYLKTLENDYRCSGFCYQAAEGSQSDFSGILAANASSSGEAVALHSKLSDPTTSKYPPTLFSDKNFQASCEGMAARDMKNYVGDIGGQLFFQGVYLVGIAIGTSFLKLVGFCIWKERDTQYAEKNQYGGRP